MKKRCTASVRTVVEFALLSGSLMPGSLLARARDGLLGHQARQQALPDARAEVVVRGRVKGEVATLDISGRIDVLYERDGVPVVEELKLAPVGEAPSRAAPVHRAQAVCYGYLLEVPEAIIRVMYIHRDGTEVIAFEERMARAQLAEAFDGYVRPYMAMLEDRLRWMETRDASIRALPFPFDAYRSGQRDMSVQTYWAIKSRKRLFAQAPTGTGKTMAALYPALKALAESLTTQVFYLTARTTGQQNAAMAVERMRARGLRVRALVMTAKEKLCPHVPRGEDVDESQPAWRCDVLACPHAIGFFDRLPEALADMRRGDDWSRAAVEAVAARHTVCPFEFGLSLAEEADVVIGDYNYAFDPGARIRRVFQFRTDMTLLVDEAHNLPERARGMLSAELDSEQLRDIRRVVGKARGRRHPLYGVLGSMAKLIEAQDAGVEKALPEGFEALLVDCMDTALQAVQDTPMGDLTRVLIAAVSTLERFDPALYAVLHEKHGRYHRMTLYCLDPAPHLEQATRKLRGSVFFSATLTPLAAWRDLIGGTEADGLLSLPSPFPQENLLVLRIPVETRYRAREHTAETVARAIATVAQARPGNYLACFPSYAYLKRVLSLLEGMDTGMELLAQRGGMNDGERSAFLDAFVPRERGALIGMVVMGGVFGEGVDLPGERLSGVIIVGVGLPQVCDEREMLRAYYDEKAGTGFAQAYRYPGMNKVLQAVGRVIRTETDRGVALLIDDRFLHVDYAGLMPPWWAPAAVAADEAELARMLRGFWRQ